jgi:ribA/ribD-fused uncharacterized protein
MKNDSILEFFGEYRFLSNFYPAEFVWEGIVWPTSEHAFQAAKTLDKNERLQLSKILNPGDVKRAGKKLDLREDWPEVKLHTMYEVVYAKFNQNPSLKRMLLATGHAYLEEGNNWGDVIWGVCDGVGQNNLGLILMRVRTELETKE